MQSARAEDRRHSTSSGQRLFIRLISDMHLAPVISPLAAAQKQAEARGPDISETSESILATLTAKKSSSDGNSILVLAGDIGDTSSDPYRRLLTAARGAYSTVLLVPGNHEYYTDGARDMGVVKEQLGRMCREIGVTLLDNEDVVIRGIRFVGSTCWPEIPEEMYKVLKRDGYGLVTRISRDSHRLDFADYKKMHDEDVRYLEATIRLSREPCVIITHYPPSAAMLDDRFEHSPQVAIHYNAGLVDRVAKTQGATPLWLSGHSHTSKRFWARGMNTLLAANCVEGGQYDPDFVIELKAAH